MIYRTAEVVKDVLVAIDENRRSDQLIAEGDIDTLSLEAIIRSKIEEGVRMVHCEAPLTMLESGHTFVGGSSGDLFIDDSGRGFVALPRDFMRLLIFRMSDWERPVTEAISESDARYKLQFSRYKGIYGNPQKPVVAIVRRSEGKVLEFFSCKDSNAKVAQASYIPFPAIKDGLIDISEECYRAAVYRISALALATLKDELSTALMEISRGFLGINN